MPSPYREEHDRYIARFLETRKPRIIGKRRELTGQRRDGSIFPLELTVTQIDHLSLFAGVIRDLSEKRALEREVANTSALEQERIGREIHDGIGQQLTGLNILAVSLKNELAAAGYADSRKLDDVIEQLTALIGNSRTLARGLAPVAVGPRGLLDALTRFAGQINDTTGIACSFRHNLSNGDPWDSASATQIYRIAQEAANNALKYADAGRIDIALSETDGTIELLVSDDGRGFDLDAVQQSDGFGLRIMQYRAGILGGQLSIDTAPGAGTTVKFRMSLHAPRP
jgi:signal transduction histidine kinase